MQIDIGINAKPGRRRQRSACDLLTERMQTHEKTAWMLRSLLE
jgi:DNA-binding ferritin-like protein